MHPITAESLAVSGFPGKKKRTKHQHIVSMFGPIMVRVVGVEPTRITSQEPKGYVTLVKDFQSPPYHKGEGIVPNASKDISVVTGRIPAKS